MRKTQYVIVFLTVLFGVGGTIFQLGQSDRPLESISYFTTLSNAFAGLVFAIIFVDLWRHKTVHVRLISLSHIAAVSLMVTFLVYHFALRPTLNAFEAFNVGGPLDISLHYITPLLTVGAYFLMPLHQDKVLLASLKPIVFPLAYLSYVIIYVTAGGRFTLDDVEYRQPYFFLDLERFGFFGVLGNIIGLAMVFALLAWITFMMKRQLKRNEDLA